jgi:purine-nucleoside phosphorylase
MKQEYIKDKGGNHMIPTPHIQASNAGEIAEDILLPGDPLRARFIAETYFSDVVQFNSIRNALGYTGSYRGKKISVLGTGMGMPSIGIYSYELIHFYGVKNLIRVGSCGAFQEDLKLYDIIMGMSASTNSNYQEQYGLPGIYAPAASYRLLEKAAETAKKKGIPIRIGNILSSDIFYNNNADAWKKWAAMGVLAVEMEAAALYMNAAKAGADALCILTVSDSLATHYRTSSEDREKTFTKMMEIALDMLVDQ